VCEPSARDGRCTRGEQHEFVVGYREVGQSGGEEGAKEWGQAQEGEQSRVLRVQGYSREGY